MNKFTFAISAKAVRRGLIVVTGLALSLGGTISVAEETEEVSDEKKLIITGSRLSRTQVEGAAPVTTITAEDIEARGFTTVFEVLDSLTQVNGSSQGAQDGGTFTQGADSLNLRAVGPGRTLTLVNGRRMSDYPLPFNGQSNIVNVANIPTGMVERIEVLSSGASAIYGSDAIAGVINIILKDHMEGMKATVRVGDTFDGGGESYRLQFTGGYQADKFDLVYSFEAFNREAINASDRKYIDSLNDNPDVINGITNVTNSRSFLVLTAFNLDDDGLRYVDPGQETCEGISSFADNSIEHSFRNGAGYFCGTANDVGFATIRNAKENYSGYFNMTYQLNSDHELFSTLVLTDSETEFDVGTNFWSYSGNSVIGAGYFFNTAAPDVGGLGGDFDLWQRIFTPEEVEDNANHSFETAIDFSFGARGQFFGGFDYEATFSFSDYDLKRERRLIDAVAADNFFLGQSTGITDFSGFGIGLWNTFNADRNRIYQPLSRAEYRSISGIDNTSADSQNMTSTLVLTNEEIAELPGGPVGLALVLEAGSQEYDITLDPKLVAGEWANFTGSGGGGERDRFALGGEIRLPLLDELSVSMAARWDKYDDQTNVDDATTYNVGLEYRPTDNLLIRGTLATSFRAPDMHFVYAGASGFFASVNDEYLCRRDQLDEITLSNGNLDFNLCNVNIPIDGVGVAGSYIVEGARQGSTFLEEEEGESLTFGFVLNLSDNATLTADYYKITLENAVRDRSRASLLEIEADCRLGVTTGGSAVDINSAECQNVLGIITRNPVSTTINSELLQSITTGPINAALRETSGYDVSFNYQLDTASVGNFDFDVNWNITDNDEDQQFTEDEIRDRRTDKQLFDYRSQVTAAANWRISDWSTTLTAIHTGSIPNWAETARCCDRTTYNLTVGYEVNESLRLLGVIVNLRNKSPQTDPTFNTYPYYFTGQHDAYGREYSLQAEYSFGG